MRSRFVRAGLMLALLGAPAMAQAQGEGQRSMAFEPGLGEAAQERVPGGKLVLAAYAFALVVIGGYVAFVARSAARLEDDVRNLEDALAKRGDAPR